MKEASIIISTKYKDDDNNGNSNALNLCSIIFLSSSKYFPMSDPVFLRGDDQGR